MKKILKIVLLVLVASLVLGAAGFLIWAETPSQPQAAALTALQSDAQVTVTETDQYITFAPANGTATTGFIFYPGGRVDYRSYAPILHQIAAEGYLVALVPVRLNLAFFDLQAGAPVLRDFPQIQTWVVGGHSLGGVAASIFAPQAPEVKGLVFWASYPADDKLKNSSLKILSISGTLDGLATPDKIEASRANLPAETRFVPIQGGNHAQFGAYGPQPGDNPATLSPADQWQQTTAAVVQFLQSLQP